MGKWKGASIGKGRLKDYEMWELRRNGRRKVNTCGDFSRRCFGNFEYEEQILLWEWTPLKTGFTVWKRGRMEDKEGNHQRIFKASTRAMGSERMSLDLSLNNSTHQIWEPDFLFKIEDMILEEIPKDENIGNHGYIGTSILWIYWRYIGGYFGKKYR